MFNKSKIQEKSYLEKIRNSLLDVIKKINDEVMGKAHYESPSGTIAGEILLKRQYRIRKGRMEFMLENSLNIHDDILQQELSKASDDKMKHIVATIQRDQNAIIRN